MGVVLDVEEHAGDQAGDDPAADLLQLNGLPDLHLAAAEAHLHCRNEELLGVLPLVLEGAEDPLSVHPPQQGRLPRRPLEDLHYLLILQDAELQVDRYARNDHVEVGQPHLAAGLLDELQEALPVPQDPEQQRSQDVRPHALLHDLLHVPEHRLQGVLEGQQKRVEVDIVEALVEVAQAVVELCQLVQQLELAPALQDRQQFAVEVADAGEQDLPLLLQERLAPRPHVLLQHIHVE